MLNKERVDEVFWLLRKMLNVDEKFSYKGIPVNDILPLLQKDLVRMIIQKEDESEAMLDWFANAVFTELSCQTLMKNLNIVFQNFLTMLSGCNIINPFIVFIPPINKRFFFISFDQKKTMSSIRSITSFFDSSNSSGL